MVQQILPTSGTDADGTYTSQNYPNLLTKANFVGDNVFYYYEAVMKTSAGTGYSQLYNRTDSSAVSGSELSTTSTSYQRKYSADLASALTTIRDYDSQIKGGSGTTASVASSWIVVQIGASGAVQSTKNIIFTNAAPTLTAGVCNGTASVFTMQLQDEGGTPTNPTATTVVRVSSNSTDYTVYSDSTCSTIAINGDFSYSTADNTKSVYIVDRRGSSGLTRTLTGTRQSGDTLTTGTQDHTVNAINTRIGGNAAIRGNVRIQ